MTRSNLSVALALCICLASCSGRTIKDRDTPEANQASKARAVNEVAVRVAVSKVGAKVCREIAVGISEHDLIRGEVAEVASNRVKIRVTDAGRFPQTIGNVVVTPGIFLSDTPLNWRPCT